MEFSVCRIYLVQLGLVVKWFNTPVCKIGICRRFKSCLGLWDGSAVCRLSRNGKLFWINTPKTCGFKSHFPTAILYLSQQLGSWCSGFCMAPCHGGGEGSIPFELAAVGRWLRVIEKF